MRTKRNTARVVCTALCAVALASLGLASSASAKLVGEFTKFEQCPWTTAGVAKCLNSVTESGEVVLGNKTVTIEKPVTIQGGFSEPGGDEFSTFYAAKNGITLSKAPQNVPGGLLGIVPSAESPPLVKSLIKFFTENALTGLSSTLELAQSASNIRLSEVHLSSKVGVALKMPVKVHLENPFLGNNCYVGSSTSPITLELTSGATSPPAPNTSIEGKAGKIKFIEGGRILRLIEDTLVDNAWSAPKASGCGGILGFLVNPIVNTQLGNTTAGHNTAILHNTINISTATAVKKNDEEHP